MVYNIFFIKYLWRSFEIRVIISPALQLRKPVDSALKLLLTLTFKECLYKKKNKKSSAITKIYNQMRNCLSMLILKT